MASFSNNVDKKIEITNSQTSFIGGMNTYATDDKTNESEVRLIQNMDIDNYGSLEKRTGIIFDSINCFDFSNEFFQGSFDFIEIVNDVRIEVKIIVIAGKIYRVLNNTFTQLYPYIYDELSQLYDVYNASDSVFLNGFNNGADNTKTTFDSYSLRPVTATYSKGVLLIATGWKLLEYGLFDDKDISGNESLATKSYYLRSIKVQIPSENKELLYGGNLLSQYYYKQDIQNDEVIINSNSTPKIVDIKYSITMLEYIGTPEAGYYKYVPALTIEPIVSVGENSKYEFNKYQNSDYLSTLEEPTKQYSNVYLSELSNSTSGEILTESELNSKEFTEIFSIEDNSSNVSNISSINTNKKWYFANLIDKNRYHLKSVGYQDYETVFSLTNADFDYTFSIDSGVTIPNPHTINPADVSINDKIYKKTTEGTKSYLYSYTVKAKDTYDFGVSYIKYEIIYAPFFKQEDYEKYRIFNTLDTNGLKYRNISNFLLGNYYVENIYFNISKIVTQIVETNTFNTSTALDYIKEDIDFDVKLQEIINGLNNKPYINNCNLILNYNNGIFLSGDIDNTNAYYQCYLDDYTYFPSNYVDAILGTYTTTITNMTPYRNGFLLFTDREIYYRTELNPQNRNLKQLNNTLGCVSNFGSTNIGNDCIFLSYDGVYRIFLTYGTTSDNFNVKKIDLKIDNILTQYIPRKFNAFDFKQTFVTRYKNYVYFIFTNSFNQSIIYKYNELNQNWSVDLINDCGRILSMRDKNNYIEYISSLKTAEIAYTKSFVQFDKDRIELFENELLLQNKVLDKNVLYSDNATFNSSTLSGTKGSNYTSVVETTNNYYNNYTNQYKKYIRWIINTAQDKKYFTKLYLTVYIDDNPILKPYNFIATYNSVTNTVEYNENVSRETSFVWDNEKEMFVATQSEDVNEAIITVRNNVIPLPSDIEEPQITTTSGDLAIVPIVMTDDGESHLINYVSNYGGYFNISTTEVPNIDKFVANIKSKGISTRIRIEQTDSQYFALTSLAYMFKFGEVFKKW